MPSKATKPRVRSTVYLKRENAQIDNFPDLIGIGLLLSSVVTIFLYDLIALLPNLPRNKYFIVHTLFLAFSIANTVGNAVKLFYIDTSVRVLQWHNPIYFYLRDFEYCPKCHTNVPPRSIHCKICQTCILRGDHHCIFVACCVGYLNHRYFLVLLVHLWLHCAYVWYYSHYIEISWLKSDCHPSVTDLYYMFPFCLTLEWNGWFRFIVLVAVNLCFYGFIYLFLLILHHFFLLTINQTTYERRRSGEQKSNHDISENIKSVLGVHYLLVFLWYNLESPLGRTGIDFTYNTAKAYN